MRLSVTLRFGIVLLVACCGGFVLGQPTPSTKPSGKDLFGDWDVAYTDTVLGAVTGTASVGRDGNSGTVLLSNPETKTTAVLKISSITASSNEYIIKLSGPSPSPKKLKPDPKPGDQPPPAVDVDPYPDDSVLPESVNRIPVPAGADKVTITVEGVSGEAPIQPRQQADLNTVELHLTRMEVYGQPGMVMFSGQWLFRADPLTKRDRGGGGRVGTFIRDRKNPNRCYQIGSENWTRRPDDGSGIAGVVCLTDQTGYMNSLPNHGYPFAPHAPRLGTGDQGDSRRLFIFGRNLPRDYSKKIDIRGDDGTIDYFVEALSSERNLHPTKQDWFAQGFRDAVKGLPEDMASEVRAMDAMVVTARLRRGVTPGLKEFRCGSANGSWILRFGDDKAALGIARMCGDKSEFTETLFLPEQFHVEIQLGIDIPVGSIELEMAVNNTPVTFNGTPSVTATRVPDPPEYKRHDGDPYVYRSPVFELYETRRPPPRVPGVYYLPVKAKDVVRARLADKYLLRTIPVAAQATIRVTPSELGETWKEALKRAANCAGLNVTDWGALSGKQAAEYSNYILWNAPASMLKAGSSGKGSIVTTRVTVAEHAALLLLRDALLVRMDEAIAKLPTIKGEAAVRAFRKEIESNCWDDKQPWKHITIKRSSGVSGGGFFDISMSLAMSESYLKETFGEDKDAAEKWSLQAVEEGANKYQTAVREARKKAGKEETPDREVKDLLKLIGRSYEPCLPLVTPRMMRLETVEVPSTQPNAPPNKYLRWTADLNARYSLAQLHTVMDALQAQEDYSKLDTQMVMLELAAVTAPFMLGEGAFCCYVLWASDGIAEIVALAEIPEAIRQREDVQYALGASAVLGTDLLNEAVMRKSEWFQVFAAVAPATLGFSISSIQAIPHVSRHVAALRTALLLSRLEKEGIAGLSKLSEIEKQAVATAVLEAKMLEEAGATKTMTRNQKRAAALADTWASDAKPKVNGEPKPGGNPASEAPTNIVKAEGERPAPPRTEEEMAPTVKEPEPQESQTLTVKEERAAPPNAPPSERAAYVPVEDARWQGAPPPNSTFEVKVNGNAFRLELGERIKPGGFVWVYELKAINGRIPSRPKVVKILRHNDDIFFESLADVARNTDHGAQLLAEGRPIKHLETEVNLDASTPFIIQDRLDPKTQHTFSLTKKVPVPGRTDVMELKLDTETFLRFARDKELQRAVVDLYFQLKEKGLIWEDAHIENMYFEEVGNGKYEAGILDSDRIIRFNERQGDMGAWFCLIETQLGKRDIHSLHASRWSDFKGKTPQQIKEIFRLAPGPYFPDAEFFMMKMFEHKRMVLYNPHTKEWSRILISPEIIKERFPTFMDPVHETPIDLTRPIWSGSWIDLRLQTDPTPLPMAA